jgi:putative copper export protein
VILARWALYVSALGLIGAFGATFLSDRVSPRLTVAARALSIAMVLAVSAIFLVQRYVWFGGEGITEWDNYWLIVSSTVWGTRWAWLAILAVTAAVVLTLVRTRPMLWMGAIAAISIAISFVAPLIGHAGSHDTGTRLLHSAHLIGAGLWIGSLGMTVLAGFNDPPALLARLRRFAPLAFSGAALVGVSGVMIAWEHVQPVSALWSTAYGRVLSAKFASVLVVGGIGFVNWREPRMRTVVAEVALAFTVVLALAAWLSELPIARMRDH